eukprot:512842-Rhodomonas_salina.1
MGFEPRSPIGPGSAEFYDALNKHDVAVYRKMVGCFMYQGVYNPAFVGRAEDLLARDVTVLNSGVGHDVSSELNQ